MPSNKTTYTEQINLWLNRTHTQFINGQWKLGEGKDNIEVINPSNGSTIAEVTTASLEQVREAAQAAKTAFEGWRKTTGKQRAKYLMGIAKALESRRDDLIELQMLNNGKPKMEAQFDVDDAIACFNYYAQKAENLDADTKPFALSDASFEGQRSYAAIGPVALIVPWNFPLVTSAWKIAPALAAGCSVVIKISEITPLAELVYGDIAQQIDLPKGVLNILTGFAEVGKALVEQAEFRKISFTGSNQVGSLVMSSASKNSLPVSLELGGKSPIVVFEDADLDLAIDIVAAGIFMNSGQMCSATSRLILQRNIADEFLLKLKDKIKSMVIDQPFNEKSEMGPMTSKAQYDKVMAYFEKANQQGIKCLIGGKAVEKDAGYFIEPTVYLDSDEMPIDSQNFLWREEIFGPVLVVKYFDDDNEAIDLANDSDFGLVATLVSKDEERARQMSEQIDCGHIWINSFQIIMPESMWGGFKASGIGRELGPSGLKAYQQEKFIPKSKTH